MDPKINKFFAVFKKKDFLAIIFFLFLTLFFFWKFFLRGLIPIPADIIVGIYYPWRDYIWDNFVAGVPFKNSLLSDVVSIIYPWRIYGIELLKKGIWPLWIPHTLTGSPLLANFQSGLFYPLNFLFFIFSDINAWSLYIIFQPILASFFCFAFLRNLKLNIISSLVGGFIFAFSGFLLVWLEYGIVGHAGLWLPLILLTIDKLFEKNSFYWVVIGSLAVGFSLLAGYPLISFLVLLASLFYVGYQVFFRADRKKDASKALFYIFCFFVLGFSLASIQLLPGFELWWFSIRQTDPTTVAFNFGLNPLKNLILFLAPDFYGNPTTGNFWGWGAYNESASYVSVAGFLLAIIGFLNYRGKETSNFFRALLIFSFLMVFNNPISNFIFNLRLPILASSSAGRFLFLTDFSLAVLAAYGTEFFLSKRKNLKFLLVLLLIFIPFIFILGVVFLRPEIWPGKDLLSNLTVARRNLILPLFLFAFTFILFFALFLKPLNRLSGVILYLLFLLIIFDLFRFGFKYTPFTKRTYLYPETELTYFLKKQKDIYRFVGLIPSSMFIPYNLSSPGGYEPLMIKRYSEFANQINEEKFTHISAGSRWVTVNRYDSKILDLLGVKYLLSLNFEPKSQWDPQYFKYPEEGHRLAFQYGKSQVYERLSVLPRAFIAHDFQILTDTEILKTLMSKDFDPLKTLLIEDVPQDLPEKQLSEDEVVVDYDSYFTNKVRIRTRTTSKGFLFLSDAYYPGWKAYVDGRATKIYRADYVFRAVSVSAGNHIVDFVYDPSSFKIGALISLITAIVLIGFSFTLLIKRKQFL